MHFDSLALPGAGSRRRRFLAFALVLALLAPAAPAGATLLLAPGVGTPDSALNGAGIARPITPEYAAFANPAAFADFDPDEMSLSFGLAYGHTRVEASAPPGYSDTHHFLAMVPGFGSVLARNGDWTLGLAVNGSVGSSFDFEKDPARGIDGDFFAELSVVTVAPTLALAVNDRLNVGFSITPLFGYLRVRAPVGFPFNYTLRGPGIQAIAGAQYHASERVSLGLGIRTPGIIFMDGSAPTPVGRSDMDLEMEMPAQVFAGINVDLSERLELAVGLRWTESSSFGRSIIEVDRFSAVNTPVMPDADDEWRASAGLIWKLSPVWRLYAGAGIADRIIGDQGANPIVFDVAPDVKTSLGLSRDFGAWTFDATAGVNFAEGRRIDEEEALVLPGRYEGRGEILFLGLRRGFD